MSLKDRLVKKRRIYIIGHTPSRCYDWMEGHGFLRAGWRDPRVVILATVEQLMKVHEGADFHFQFLPGWTEGRSQEFKNRLWARVPHVMQSNHVY